LPISFLFLRDGYWQAREVPQLEKNRKNKNRRNERNLDSDDIANIIFAITVILIIATFVYLVWWIVTTKMEIFGIIFGNPWYYIYLTIACLVLSIINIPLYRNKENDTIYVNAGGCLLPLFITLYLLYNYWRLLNPLIIPITLLMIFVSRVVSWYVKGKGVLIVLILVELMTTWLACYLSKDILTRLVLGYTVSTIGVLVGGDLLHLYKIGTDGEWGDKLSIGGAGLDDGVWSVGISTMFYIMVLTQIFGW
jgi:uncharacterized membrane protein